MARIFQAIMGDVLPKENLCEKEGQRLRLPSPQELQGKIILKGSFKLSKPAVSQLTRRAVYSDLEVAFGMQSVGRLFMYVSTYGSKL